MTYHNRIADSDLLQEKINKQSSFSPNMLKQLKEYYRISFTYTSNALEGNSLTEVETKVVLEDGITIGGKPMRDHLEAVGHSHAYDLLYELVHEAKLTLEHITGLHKIFYQFIDPVQAGCYRTESIVVTGSEFAFPEPDALEQLMHDFVVDDAQQYKQEHHLVEYAAWLHGRFVTIHPFVDGNGRTARLLMNLVLMQAGYPIVLIPPIIRLDYLAATRAANNGDCALLINFISQMVLESQKDLIRLFHL